MQLEPLSNNLQVYVSDDHKFSSDTVLLSHFSKPSSRHKVIEFCSGCGALSLMWFNNSPPKHVVCADIQQEACELLNKSINFNNLHDQIKVMNTDIRKLAEQLPCHSFNSVVCNPPYNPMEGGLRPESAARLMARHQSDCTIKDVVEASTKLLRTAGRLFMCYRPEGLCDILCTMRQYNIEPKRLRFVYPMEDKPPKLFLIEGRRNASPGLLVMPSLIMNDPEGNLTREMEEIYSPFLSSVYNTKQGYRVYGG